MVSPPLVHLSRNADESILAPDMPFRHPDRGDDLRTRIDAEVRERLEEAIDYVCLEAQVQARRAQNLPPPAADSDRDRDEFTARVDAFLRLLHEQIPAGLAPDAPPGQPALAAGDEAGMIAAQVCFARTLPDYWQRFEEVRADFGRDQLGSAPPGPGWLRRRFGG